jgi:hypothetical protein
MLPENYTVVARLEGYSFTSSSARITTGAISSLRGSRAMLQALPFHRALERPQQALGGSGKSRGSDFCLIDPSLILVQVNLSKMPFFKFQI